MTIYSPPGSIRIDKMMLTNYNGSNTIDLTLICYEFNIFESINKPFVTASFLIRDATSLLTRFPIIGQETLQVTFKTPDDTFTKNIDMTFRVVGINNVERKQAREVYYILSCVSPGMIKDMNTRIRKAYSNMSISDMVSTIWEENIGEQLKFVDPTIGQRTIVIPNYSPSRAVKFLCREAKSQYYESSNYCFYQNCDGFYFQTTDNMIDPQVQLQTSATSGISLDKYYGNDFDQTVDLGATDSIAGNAKQITSNKPLGFLKLNHFQYQNIGNYMKSGVVGALENTFRFFDPLTSYYVEKKYDYMKDNSVFKKTTENQASTFLTNTNDYIKDGESYIGFEPTNFTQNNEYANDQKPDMLHYKHGAKTIFENLIAQIIIPGDSEKRAGEVIRLQLPEYGATDDVQPEINKFISGEYLILSVRQMYNSTSYNTVMTVAKNAYQKDIESVVQPSSSIAANNGPQIVISNNVPRIIGGV